MAFQDISNQELKNYYLSNLDEGYKPTQIEEVIDYFKTTRGEDDKEIYAHLSGYESYVHYHEAMKKLRISLAERKSIFGTVFWWGCNIF